MDCFSSGTDKTDKAAITMFAKDLIPADHKPSSRSRKYYTFHDNYNGQDHGPIPFPRHHYSVPIALHCHDPTNLVDFPLREGKYAVCLSFFELYQDRIYDLLDDTPTLIQKRKHLPLKRDVQTGRRYVSGLRRIIADSAEVFPPPHPHTLLGHVPLF